MTRYANLLTGLPIAPRRTFVLDMPDTWDDDLVKAAVRRWGKRRGYRLGIMVTHKRLTQRQIVIAVKGPTNAAKTAKQG